MVEAGEAAAQHPPAAVERVLPVSAWAEGLLAAAAAAADVVDTGLPEAYDVEGVEHPHRVGRVIRSAVAYSRNGSRDAVVTCDRQSASRPIPTCAAPGALRPAPCATRWRHPPPPARSYSCRRRPRPPRRHTSAVCEQVFLRSFRLLGEAAVVHPYELPAPFCYRSVHEDGVDVRDCGEVDDRSDGRPG